jgi:hypothetical protein
MNKKITTTIIVYISFFLISTFYFLDKKTTGAVSFIKKNFSSTNTDTNLNNQPKTETCPLNGALYSKLSKEAWESRRPLGIMVENSIEARPQSGLSSADVVFEAVAEGGITRFLAVYYCEEPETVGPVRSARVYFIDFIAGFGNKPLYAHVGGANTPGPADALGQIIDMGWANYNDLNQFSLSFPIFWRDNERLPGVALEHTMYTNTQRLWQKAIERSLTNVDKKGESWSDGYRFWGFEKDASLSERPNGQVIKFGFWEDYLNFSVSWRYNTNTNSYLRYYGNSAHIDKNTNKPLTAKNIAVLFMDESVANDGYEKGQHLLYKTIGKGKAVVFKNGKAVIGEWQKKDRFSQVFIFDSNGKEISFVEGKIWFEILPTGNKLTY